MNNTTHTTRMTPTELAAIIDDHRLWLAGEGGKRADLRGADLRDANLSDAGLSYANQYDANLRGADLRYANLSDAGLSYASLDETTGNARIAKQEG